MTFRDYRIERLYRLYSMTTDEKDRKKILDEIKNANAVKS